MMRDELMNVIDNNISRFLEHLAQSYPQAISMPQLQQSWQDFKTTSGRSKSVTFSDSHHNTRPAASTLTPAATTTTPVKASPAPVTKKSGYQNFFTIRRIELKAENSDLSFGELSKIISAEWNVLQPSEKSRYVNPPTTVPAPAPAPVPVPLPAPVLAAVASTAPVVAPTAFTLNDLNDKKMDELKELCEARNLKKSGNKTELIRRLLGYASVLAPSSSSTLSRVSPALVMEEASEKRDSSLDIYVSSKSEKRSDFEHSATTPEEEDFEFENLSDKFNSDDSDESTIQDDDDDDDDDAFGITE